jgi:hypothetical protein
MPQEILFYEMKIKPWKEEAPWTIPAWGKDVKTPQRKEKSNEDKIIFLLDLLAYIVTNSCLWGHGCIPDSTNYSGRSLHLYERPLFQFGGAGESWI